MNKKLKKPLRENVRHKEIIVFRILLVVEIVVGAWYVLAHHQWDGGMFHIAVATILKDFAEA